MFSLETTKQEIFEIVANHLLTQNAKAEKARRKGPPQCLYLTLKGKKCAVGILIPDGHAAQDSLSTIKSVFFEFGDLSTLYGSHIDLLIGLQLIHDKELVPKWLQKLRYFGRRHKLDNTFLLAPNRKKNGCAV